MAGLLEDLLSGRSSDIYGAGLLTPAQRGGIGNIGLLALAGKLGQLAGPSFSPVPDFGAALGQAAGAYGASQEGAGTAALNAILTGQKGRKLEQELDYYKQLGPILGKLGGDWPGAGGGAGGAEGSGSTGGGAAAPLGAGGGGVGGTPGTITLDQARQAAVNAGFTGPAIDIAAATGMAESNGNPLAHNTKGENSYGYMQLNAAAHGDKVKTFDLQEQMNHAFAISKQGTDFSPWTMYRNGQYKKYLSPGGTAPAAAAPAPAGGGGLLAPTAPNPLSDADPIAPVVRAAAATGGGLLADPNRITVPPPAGGTAAPGNPQPGDMVNGLVFKGGDPKDPRSWAVAPRGAITPSGGGAALEEPPGFAGRQLIAQLGARPPLDDVSQYRQVAGPGAADAAATPRAPLPTMGPAGIELPPMQGPLAAPAPAAAPAAPGPGLLSPPGMPAAPALPRVNPAYDAYLRNLGIAGALSKGAGLPDVLGPLTDALKASPSFQAEVEKAKRAAGFGFITPEEEAKAKVKLQYDPLTEARKRELTLPYDLLTEQEKQRLQGAREKDVAANAPQNLGPAQTLVLPPGSPAAKTYRDAAINGPLPPNVKLNPDGSVQVTGGNAATFNNELAQLNAKNFMDRRTVALDAGRSVAGADEARKLLDAGIFAGAGSNWQLAIQKAKNAFGWDDEKVANTETFIAQRASEVGRLIKQFGSGTGLSDADREFATGIAGGSIKLDEKSIRRILDISERASRNVIGDFNRDASKIDSSASPYPLTVPTHDEIRQQRQQQSQQGASAGGLDFSKMSLPDLTAAVTRGDLTLDQRRAIDKRFRELGH